MLPSILLAAVLASQAVLSPDDVPGIVTAVVDWATSSLGQPLGDRPVFLAAESAAAFRALVPDASAIPLANDDATYRVRPADEVLTCVAADRCTVAGGGVLVKIEGVATGEEAGNEALQLEPGEYMLAVVVTPPQHTPNPHDPVDNPRFVTLAERDGAWTVIDAIFMVF